MCQTDQTLLILLLGQVVADDVDAGGGGLEGAGPPPGVELDLVEGVGVDDLAVALGLLDLDGDEEFVVHPEDDFGAGGVLEVGAGQGAQD